MKKETLEEAAERLYPDGCDGTNTSAEIYRRLWIDGAKYQQEQYKNKYSEEEVLHLLDTLWDSLDIWYNEINSDKEFNLKDWFKNCELNKKKR